MCVLACMGMCMCLHSQVCVSAGAHTLVHRFYVNLIKCTRGEGGLRPPSPLVWVAGATLISSEAVVFSEFIQLLSVISI